MELHEILSCYSAIRRWAYLNTIFGGEKVDLRAVIYGIHHSCDFSPNLTKCFRRCCLKNIVKEGLTTQDEGCSRKLTKSPMWSGELKQNMYGSSV